MAHYTFYDKLDEKADISLPRLSNYSDWLIPYSDMKDEKLFTFYPESSGDATNYTNGFSLVSIDTASGKQQKVIKEGLENEPISISPDGKWSLYGFYLEGIINLETGKVIPLFQTVKADA